MSIKTLGAISVLVLSMGTGLAQAGNVYVGGSIGQASVQDWITDAEFENFTGVPSNTEDSDTAFKVYVGVTVSDNVDFRAGYAKLGEATARASVGNLFYQLSGESQAFFVDALAKFKPADQLALFAKIGISSTEFKLSTEQNVSGPVIEDKTSEVVFVPGVGIAFDVTPSLGLVAEYERYLDGAKSDVLDEKSDIDVVSIGAYFHF